LVDCAYFPEAKTLVLVNGSGERQGVRVQGTNDVVTVNLEGFSMKVVNAYYENQAIPYTCFT
jgi:beta-D-galactosyl-(1->4)-L-rhamnose phosphorylase